jgi:hypothetical protein
VLSSWKKAWKENELSVTVVTLVWQNKKSALIQKKKLVEKNFDFMEQVQRGAKNVKMLIFWLFRVLLYCSSDSNKIHLLGRFLIL